MRESLINGLKKYLPAGVVLPMAELIIELNIHLRISRERTTKMGDYRPPQQGRGHRISINHNLNQFAFFITLVHEIAHLIVWNKYQNLTDPHGKEWKACFKQLMLPYLGNSIFPDNIERALARYLINPAASSCSDPTLFKLLAQYDDTPAIHLDDLPSGAQFQLPNGMTFIKGEKRRTRYTCKEIHSERTYLVSGIAIVELIRFE